MFATNTLLYQFNLKQIENLYVWDHIWHKNFVSNGVMGNTASGF